MKYQIIYADCPWEYWQYSKLEGKKATKCGRMLYPTMPLEQIKALPIQRLADDNCALFLWVTMPQLDISFEVIKAWGFKYKTCAFTWVKLNPNSMGTYSGLGHWTNSNAELCLLATKGSPKRLSKDVKQIIMCPRSEHSRKPSEVRERIVRLLGDIPRIELFARQKVAGWDCWGNEVESDIEL